MSVPTSPPQHSLSLRKRVAFSLVIGFFVWLILETFACWHMGGFDGSDKFVLERAKAVAVRAEGRETEAIHPYMGWCLDPITDRAQFAGRSAQVNEVGFVDEGPTLQRRASGQILVGICGGSVAQHVALNSRGVLQEKLGENPRFRGKEIKIVSLALSGFKQPQQLMAVNYVFALGGELDVLINIDGYNEIALPGCENFQQGVNYAYPRQWHVRTIQAVAPHANADALALLTNRGERQAAAQRYLRSPLQFSYLRLFAWDLLDRGSQQRLGDLESRMRAERTDQGRGMTRDGPRNTAKSLAEVQQQAVDLWRNSSLQLGRLCSANGVKYLHVLQPNQHLQGSKPLSAEELEFFYAPNESYGRMVAEHYPTMIRIGKELQEQGVEFFDATRIFAEVKTTIYCDPFCHYRQEGNDLLAAAIADRVLAGTIDN